METTPVFRPRHLQVKMPRGLRELMADMSREVLRNQPDPSNIHKFLADYLDSLATIRTVTWITDNITSDVKTLSQRAMQRLIDKDLQIEDKTAGFKIIQDSLRKFCLHLVGSSVAETREKCINELVENLNSISDSAKMEGYVRNLFKYVFNVFLEQYLKKMESCNKPAMFNWCKHREKRLTMRILSGEHTVHEYNIHDRSFIEDLRQQVTNLF